MQTRFPSIEALQTFEAACRLGSFERAADELALTASAVSKRITGLEELVGAALVERSSRGHKGLALTVAGKEYLTSVRAVLAQLSGIALHQRGRQGRARLRVVTPPTFAREILVPNLGRFTALQPELDLELVVAIPYLEIAPPEAEVRVNFGLPEIAGEPLLFEESQVYIATHLIVENKVIRSADILKFPLLRCPIEPWQPWFAAAGLTWDEAALPSAPTLVDFGLALEAAASGQGVTLTRPSIARRFVARGELAAPFGVRSRAGTGYCLQVAQASSAALVFAQWLRGLCAELSATAPKA
jgi:LysR family transcriptional regulator, glycine cleavage system transcriptional activator